MSIIKGITALFAEQERLEVNENFTHYTSQHLLGKNQDFNSLRSHLPSLLEQLFTANIELFITLETTNPIIISSGTLEELEERLGELEELIPYHSDSTIKAELRIEKGFRDIFDFEAFISYLTNLSIQEGMAGLSESNASLSMDFRVWERVETQWTDTIVFSSVYPEFIDVSELNRRCVSAKDREAKLEKRDKCGHFANASQLKFIPEDFYPSNILDEGLKKYLNGLHCAALLVFLSDFSSIDGNVLKYRLKGYKLLSESLDAEPLKQHSNYELNSIYNWTYTEGDFTDKIGLSRNVMSIHLSNDSLLSIETGASDSVKSGYDLYLKDNVKQYIEIKNKISEFIQGQSDKASAMTKDMFSMFKTGLWAFTTFFISTFLLRVVAKGGDSAVFNTEVYVVSLLLIAFSFIYMVIAIIEINTDRDRLLKKYGEVKARYKELLNPNDLNKILDDEAEKEKENTFINTKRNTYVACWIFVNVLLFIAVSALYCYSNMQTNQEKGSATTTETTLIHSQNKVGLSQAAPKEQSSITTAEDIKAMPSPPAREAIPPTVKTKAIHQASEAKPSTTENTPSDKH